jgi:hypothetical protein
MTGMQRCCAIISIWFVTLGGCARVPQRNDAAMLMSPTAPQTVSLDLFTLRVAADEAALDESIWTEVDELQFPAELRRRLAANGIRAGVVDAAWAARVQSLLKLDEQAAAPPLEAEGTQIQVTDFEQQPPVRHRVLQIPGGRRAQVLCVGERTRVPELALLVRGDDGEVHGRTYRKAMGMFVIRAFPEGDRRVRLQLTPEVEHGEPQRRFEPGDGMLRVEFSPAHERFESLALESTLSIGQMLVLTCMSDRPGSLGHHYFTEKSSDRVMQKMLLVRLSDSGYDDLFTLEAPPSETE